MALSVIDFSKSFTCSSAAAVGPMSLWNACLSWCWGTVVLNGAVFFYVSKTKTVSSVVIEDTWKFFLNFRSVNSSFLAEFQLSYSYSNTIMFFLQFHIDTEFFFTSSRALISSVAACY